MNRHYRMQHTGVSRKAPKSPLDMSDREIRNELLRMAREEASADPSVEFARRRSKYVVVRFKDGTLRVLRTANDAREFLCTRRSQNNVLPDRDERPVENSLQAPSDLRDRMATYARHASWAIWSWPASPTRGQWAWVKDLGPVRRADPGALRSHIVVIGLNPATRGTRPVDWAAFHDSANDGRLALALRGTATEGAYMTDLVTDWNQSVSAAVKDALAKDRQLAAHHVARLHTELSDLGSSQKVLVCCGGTVVTHVEEHWPDGRDRIVPITHYAYTRDNPGRPRFSQPEVYVADVRRSLAAAGLAVPTSRVG